MRILYNKTTKQFIQITYLILGCICILFLFGYRSSPKNQIHLETFSELECEQQSCRISNLYYIQNQFRVYLNPSTVNKTWVLNDVMMNLGLIRFGSLYVRPWHEASMGPWPYHNEFYNHNGSNASSSDPFIPLFVHFDTHSLGLVTRKGLHVYEQPLVMYSIGLNNLFHTMYAGTGAIFSLMRHHMYFPENCQMVLLDRSSSQFVELLKASDAHVIWWKELKQGIYKGAVIGISRDILVQEIRSENYYEHRFKSRNIAFKTFSNRIKSNLLQQKNIVKKLQACNSFKSHNTHTRNWPRVLLISKSSHASPRILNLHELIKNFTKLPIRLSTHNFDSLSLIEQVCLVDAADIVIGMHGAALTHVLFMKQGKLLIELFPFAFRKSIYQNLASINGIDYFSWQNSKMSLSKPRLDLIKSNRLTNMSLERVSRLPIDWNNIDSIHYWSNQDTIIDSTLIKTVEFGIKVFAKYLIYLPWDTFNNQMIGFKSACALANFLNRTLVLPKVGYQRDFSFYKRGEPRYNPREYEWFPFEEYFDSEKLYESLPCRILSTDNFVSLFFDKMIDTFRYHHMSDDSTSEQQVFEYYKKVLGLHFQKLEWDIGITYLLDKQTLVNLHSHDRSLVLGLGSMFWYYDFGISIRYPLTRFYNYLVNPLYKQITRSLVFNERLTRLADSLIRQLYIQSNNYPLDNSTANYNAIHVRRGDYSLKCAQVLEQNPDKQAQAIRYMLEKDPNRAWKLESDLESFNSCFVPLPFLISKVKEMEQSQQGPLYIATNGNEADLNLLKSHFPNSKTLADLLQSTDSIKESLNSLDIVILDQLICAKALIFIGNYHSSFTRHVIEQRILDGKHWKVF